MKLYAQSKRFRYRNVVLSLVIFAAIDVYKRQVWKCFIHNNGRYGSFFPLNFSFYFGIYPLGIQGALQFHPHFWRSAKSNTLFKIEVQSK